MSDFLFEIMTVHILDDGTKFVLTNEDEAGRINTAKSCGVSSKGWSVDCLI